MLEMNGLGYRTTMMAIYSKMSTVGTGRKGSMATIRKGLS